MKKILKHFKKNWYRYGLETLVVIIGILVAFTLNNWNEQRKDRELEKEILVDLKLNLESNITLLEGRIKYFSSGQKSCKIILDVIDSRLPNHDSLGYHFSKATRGYGGADVISYVGYEALRNNGFSLITNKLLKDEIMQLFENTYRELISFDETFKLHNSYYIEVLGKLFYQDKEFSLKPYDFDLILSAKIYYSALTDFRSNYGWMKEETNNGLSETRRVLQLIDDELK
jgi:hypothetical protein